MQTTLNNMRSGKIREQKNVEIIKKFFVELDQIISTELGKIVVALSSQNDLDKMLDKEKMPYTTLLDREMYDCRYHNICQNLSDAIHDLGKKHFNLPYVKQLTYDYIFLNWSTRWGNKLCKSAPPSLG